MKTPVRFGLLGTGGIAAEVADALALSNQCVAQSVASREPERAKSFARRHGVGYPAATYHDLIVDPNVDVVYVATPHTEHEKWALAAINAGKHVLCEKPIAISASGADTVLAAALESGVFVLEAFAYWFHPQTDLLLSLIRDGAVGEVRGVDVTFSFALAGDGSSYHGLNHLAGGGILDVGCYCTSMAAKISATAIGQTTVEPEAVVGLAIFDEIERVDEYSTAVLRFPGRILAKLSCGFRLEQPDVVRVLGSDGYLETALPAWLAGHRSDPTWIDVHLPDGDVVRHEIAGGKHIFTREVDGMVALLNGDPSARAATDAATLANMRTLDRWRAAVGLRYDFEAM